MAIWSGAQSMARSVASLTGDVARMANTGTNLTIAVTEAAVALGRTSASVAAEAWNGVDLVDSVVSIHRARWAMHRSMVSARFFDSSIGQNLVPLNDTSEIWVAMEAVSPMLPAISSQQTDWITNSSYVQVSYHVAVLDTFYIGVEVLIVSLSFAVEWCNPLWSWADYNPTAMLSGLRAKLRQALGDMEAAAWRPMSFSPASLADVSVLRPSLVEEILRRIQQWWHGPLLLS